MIPTMLIVWGAFTLCFLSLLAYRATVTRYEDDQLFLSEEGSTHAQHDEQEEIFRKVGKLAPLIRIVGSAAAIMTLLIIGTYAWDAIQRLR
jgi:hypothetical protein